MILILSKELLFNKKSSPVEKLGLMPTDFSATTYVLIKRGEYFYAIYNSSPNKGTETTAIQNLNFISKTKDFKTWIGSGVGSGYTHYDEQADAFFSVTLGLNYTTNHAAYHITKINPDDFSYTNMTLMGDTALSATSRGITPIQRVGNYLMLIYYKESTNGYTCYSSDNGATWKSSKISTVSSFGLGTFGLPGAANGSVYLCYVYYNSSSYTYRYFTSPTSSAASNSKSLYSDRPGYTYGNRFIAYSSSTGVLTVSTDGKNDTSYTLAEKAINYRGYFSGNYYIGSYYGSNSTGLTSYMGKIVVYDLTTLKMYTFDPQLNICYSRTLGSYTYHYSYIKVLGIIEGYIYFTYQPQGSKYLLARVPLSVVLEQMELYTA